MQESQATKSLATTLTSAFFSVSLAGLLILGSLLLVFNIRVQQTAISRDQQFIAQNAAKTVSSYISEKMRVLETALWISDPQSQAKEKQKELLQSLLGIHPSFRELMFFDERDEESMRVSRRSSIASAKFGLSKKREALAFTHSGIPYISPIYIDETTSEPLIVIAAPVKNVFAGYHGTVIAEVNLKFMWDLVDQIKIGESGYAYVVDRKGDLISFGDAARVLKHENVKHLLPVSEFMKDANSFAPTRVRMFEGIKQTYVIGTYVPLVTPDWAVITELPVMEAFRPTIWGVTIGIVILVLIAFIMSLIGIRLSKKLSIPIVRLMSTASRIAAGEKNELAEISGPTEVAALAVTFNSMTTQLRKSYQELEEQMNEVRRAGEALRQKTEELDRYFTNALDLLCIADLDGRFKRLNKEWESTLGYSVQELEGKSFLDFVHPDDIDSTMQAISRLGKQEEVLNFINRYRSKDGPYRWIEWRSFSAGNLIYAAARDITERKRIEEALQLTRFTVEHAADQIFWINATAQIVDGNRSACMALRYSLEELTCLSIPDIDPSFDMTRWTESWNQMKNMGTISRETLFKTKEGSLFPVEIIANFIKFGGQELVCAFVRDITERKQADEIKRLLAHTMESISEIAIITDLEDKYTFVNEAFVRTYGYRQSDVLGRHVDLIWSPGNPPDLLTHILEQSRIAPWKGEINSITKEGKEFPVLLRTSQVRDEHGTIIGLVSILEDISERKHLEAQLLQSQKMEAVGRLAGGIAHDFNNMIGVILGYADLIEKELTPSDPLKRHVAAITNAAQRSANLTKQLLAFARKQVITPIIINLNDALASLSKMLVRLLGEDISLELHLGEKLWNIKVDPSQIDQILANLATNARDAIEDVGSIIIETSNTIVDKSFTHEHFEIDPGEYVILSFSDSGKGMDASVQTRIFDPFFTTKPKGQGTGLGMATVFGIVKQNNGYISIYSEVGQGTTIKIYFPRYYGEAEKPGEQKSQEPRRRTDTILVVEDEKELLALNKLTLEMYGYKVLTAQSPGDAILLYEQHVRPIRLLITDVVMPGMNGKELKSRLDSIKPGLKTIFMSGYTADVVANRGILEKGVHFLQKPFKPIDLVMKVQEVLGD